LIPVIVEMWFIPSNAIKTLNAELSELLDKETAKQDVN
jgi:hypothetical protein